MRANKIERDNEIREHIEEEQETLIDYYADATRGHGTVEEMNQYVQDILNERYSLVK